MSDLEERVAALERALEALSGPAVRPAANEEAEPDFWVLDELRRRHPAGAIVFAGTAAVGKGEVAWQWGALSDDLREAEWTSAAGVLDALAHPVRLRLLQRVLNGTTSTADLSLDDSLGTTGQLHHHLRALVAGGWLASVGRGRWTIPPHRVVPLLVVVSAATGPR